LRPAKMCKTVHKIVHKKKRTMERLCWLLSQSTHKKRRLSTMTPSIRGRMAKVASTPVSPVVYAA
jgi:hypothetical protein